MEVGRVAFHEPLDQEVKRLPIAGSTSLTAAHGKAI